MSTITSHTKRQKQVGGPPEVGITRRSKAVDPNARIYAFVNTKARMLTYKIVKYDDDPEDIGDLVNQAVNDLVSRYIQFRDWGFETTHPSVAKLLVHRQNEGDVGIYPDQTRISLRCAFCDKTFPNTTGGQVDLREHTTEMHADEFLAGTERLMAEIAQEIVA